MRFTHIDVNFDIKYEGHQNCSKTLSMHILRVFGHHHMWCQNWRQYVWTSLRQFIFFVNLLHSPCVWLFDIWHLFDNLTSFWQLDIFVITWHLFWHMGNGKCGQRGIMVNTEDTDGAPLGMVHMVDGAMGHMVNVVMCLIMCNFLNTAGIFTKILLDIDFDVFYLNIQWYSHDGLFKYKKIEGFEILIGSNIGSMNLFQWARMELAPYLCYQLDFLLDFFTEDKSYQYLQDATPFVI